MPTRRTPTPHGGARPGAGRKTNAEKGLPKLVKKTLGLPAAHLQALESIGSRQQLTWADVARHAVREYLAGRGQKSDGDP